MDIEKFKALGLVAKKPAYPEIELSRVEFAGIPKVKTCQDAQKSTAFRVAYKNSNGEWLIHYPVNGSWFVARFSN
jgi:hypothetical protein